MWKQLAKTVWLVALAAGMVPAQEPERSGSDAPIESRQGQPSLSDIERWVDELGSERFERREAAEQRLRQVGAAAAEALREAAADHADLDVRLRARRLLERVAAAADPGAPEGGLRRRTDPDTAAGPDAPEPRDSSWRSLEAERTLPGGDPRFEGLRQQMERIRRMFDAGPGMLVPGGNEPGAGAGSSLSIGPDGVRLEVTEIDADGERSTAVYEAPDLETLRREHPELADQLPAAGFLAPRSGAGRLLPWEGRGVDPFAPLRPRLPLDAPGPGEVLGVRVEALAPAVADYLQLEPGTGLLVRQVEPESLAERAAIEERDVILRIGDRAIHAITDVRLALRQIAAGETVSVVVNRFGRRLELEATKRTDAASAKESPERGPQRRPQGMLRRRD